MRELLFVLVAPQMFLKTYAVHKSYQTYIYIYIYSGLKIEQVDLKKD